MNNVSQAIQAAFQAYQSSKLVEAEWLCQTVLQQQPNHISALFLSGAIAQQTGRLDTAIVHYQTVITLDPSHFEAHNNLAIALQDRGDWDAAAIHFRHSVELNPHHAPTHFNWGNLLLKQQDYYGAIAHYQQAIQLKPNYARAYNNLGNALKQLGQWDAAQTEFQQAIALDPNYAEPYNNLGSLLQEQGQLEAAMLWYERFIDLQPQNASGYYNLASLWEALERPEAAIATYEQALALHPDQPEAHNNLGILLQNQAHTETAIAHFHQAIALKPEFADAYNNLGIAFQQQNQLDQAISQYQQAIHLNANFAEAHLNLGMAFLAAGDWQSGWAEYEWRWYCNGGQPRSLPKPQWQGSDLQGKTILIHTEQGLGDSIQFLRFVPLLAERGAKVIVECQPELDRLFQTVAGVTQVIPAGDPLPEYDLHCPLLSLPYQLGITLANLPTDIPYLAGAELPPTQLPDTHFNVGIVWAGSHRKPHRALWTYRMKSCSLSTMMPLAAVEQVQLYSLQVGFHATDITEGGLIQPITDLSSLLTDFAATAAIVAQLDLVISVDTAVAHLAGALGKPVWVLLPYAADWRWLLDREDSPWYPTMRLFRQSTPGDWQGVIQRVITALRAVAQT
ncbi:tetratricopeptide repeat protein [Pantanalinema rosaneae CENA516]|uniref:tetratricopeptide repeat protein n=1 Tax=Pantanalinema rosaneae TaxID=1620701 RepID=UPI003D6ED569